MPGSPLFAQERRERMLNMIIRRSRMSVNELAEAFGVTTATVRGDLKQLEADRLVVRTHGGVLARTGLEREGILTERQNQSEKNLIAQAAVELISNGDVISIDTGTTALSFAQTLARTNLHDVTIITSDLAILSILEPIESFSVIAIGGRLRTGFHFSCDAMALAALDLLRVDKCFLTTTSISFDEGLTTPNLDTARLKMKYLSIARESFLLVDSGKFGRVSCGKFADLGQIDHVVVDGGIDSADLARLTALVPHVHLA